MAKKKQSKVSNLQKAKNDPQSKYWKTKADNLWSEQVRSGGICSVCGAVEGQLYTNDKGVQKAYRIQAHHIIPREIKALAHELNNGIALCHFCHKLGGMKSAHRNPFRLFKWLRLNDPAKCDWLLHHSDEIATEAADYKAAYEQLTKRKGNE